jgi:nucleoside-diphosphate-sugar epimerase
VFVTGGTGAIRSHVIPALVSQGHTVAQTNRLRTAGTDALPAAAPEAGVRRFVAESFASYLPRKNSVI